MAAKNTGRASHAKGTGGHTADGASKGAMVSAKPKKRAMPMKMSRKGRTTY